MGEQAYPPPSAMPEGDDSHSQPPANSNPSQSDAQQAALMSTDINVDPSGVQANADLLGHDLADVSIGLGAVESALGLLDCGSGTGTNMQQTALLSADANVDLSGVQANADLLGHDFADVSIGLGAVEPAFGLLDSGSGTGICLVDTALHLVDDLSCGIV